VKTSQFSFDLPESSIAQEPTPDRSNARLLVLDRRSGATTDSMVSNLRQWIAPGTVMVLNDTRVRKARLFAERVQGGGSGGRSEFLLLEERAPGVWETLCGRVRRAKPGATFRFPGEVLGTIVAEGEKKPGGETRMVRFEPTIDESWLERHGHVPLPPYIHRSDTVSDEERYQTVFSRVTGSAAAPTAGLHFTPALLEALRNAGIQIAWITLHVGLGTFLPIRTEEIEDHRMHEERYSVPPETKAVVDAAVRGGKPVLAVGTTVVRTLESAWTDQGLREGEGRTSIYITPGFRFQVASMLFTNFHTPGSSLLVLVSAFAGRERILEAYAEAVGKGYRFFSYGDAMLIQ
jgi:S-adenosylmethionine:tRNA ribosyltransferase-isomerase